MAKFIKDNYIIFLISILIGLLCWLSEKAIENTVRLNIIEHKIDRLTEEFLSIKESVDKMEEKLK